MVVLLLLVASVVAVRLYVKNRRLQAQNGTLAASVRQTADQNEALNSEMQRVRARADQLSKYEAIENVEVYVAQQRAHASARLEEAQRQAEGMLADARTRVALMLDDGRRQARETLTSAQKEVEKARLSAESVVLDAERRAKETAGDALKAMANAKEFEEVARAMKNVIEGYGDRYLVPTLGILDELGEQYSFDNAGKQLKAARERVRSMIKGGWAAACDYPETERKETAIHFVLDAFNGKCDSALADVRHDNYGTLEQKLKDAFSLVNKNGQAFRNARITPEFLRARIEELRWAVAVHEVKVQEREEQRELKERMREEQKAQKEFERALKDAQKEEETLRKAMARARQEVEKASIEQRAKYEAQLAELEMKLRAAEEKNHRALSMAQQTKRGTVYVISNVGSFGERVFKIGLTRRLQPLERVRELGDASVPFEFDVHALIAAEDAPALEREFHRRFVKFQVNKVNPRKEFFRVDLGAIRTLADELGCKASWTMSAECRQYKETLAVEKQLASHALNESSWVENQLKEHDAVLAEPDNDAFEQAS